MSLALERTNLGGYRAADQSHSFDYDRGLVQLPVAGRTAATRLIRLHGGMGTRTVKFKFIRQGKPPVIPEMRDTSGDTLLDAWISPVTPIPSATGVGMDWCVSGEYTYAQNTPRIAGTHAIPVGQLPYVDQALTTQAANMTPSQAAATYQTYYTINPAQAFQNFVAAVADAAEVKPDGDYEWPFFAIPTIFVSNHIIQD